MRLTVDWRGSASRRSVSLCSSKPRRQLAKFLQLSSLSIRAKSRRPSDADANDRHPPKRMEVRMKSILDPTFRYTSSANTDLRKTFARVRREARRQTQASGREQGDATKKVTPIFRGQRPAA
jgi:hypothetical protein